MNAEHLFPKKIASLIISTILFLLTLLTGCATTTPLQNAILENDFEEAKKLAETDNDNINYQNSDGETALLLASQRVQEDLVFALLKAGADPNIPSATGISPLIEAVYDGKPSLVKLLLTNGADVNWTTLKGLTPLHFASFEGFYCVSKILINNGAEVNSMSKKEWTPLHYASFHGFITIVEHLIDNGADPNARTNEEMTPLMLAAIGGHQKVAELLILNGAQSELKSSLGNTASELAEKKGFLVLAEFLNNMQITTIPLTRPEKDAPIAIFKTLDAKLNGDHLPQNSTRARELRKAENLLLDMLRKSNLFSKIDVSDDTIAYKNQVSINLILEEAEDMHRGSNAGKAFASGFFTLGLIPPSAEYTYASSATLVIEMPDGQQKHYKAASDTTATWSGDPTGRSYHAKGTKGRKSARRLVIQHIFDSLISQMSEDKSYFIK